MNLTDAQKLQVATWIQQGLKLSEIQSRLASELGVRLTYMEVRLLVADLKLTPKDPEPEKPAVMLSQPAVPDRGARGDAKAPTNRPAERGAQTEGPRAPRGTVSVSVAEIARPGTIVSGNVTFSDGKQAEWYLDQFGRLGIVPAEQGYKPPSADMPALQRALESELSKLGF